MNNKYSLLIFDWDGTVMDSGAHITSCMQSAIAELNMDSRTDDEVRNIIGLGLEEAVLSLYSDADKQLVIRIAETFREYFLFKDKTPSPLFAGAKEVLESLKQQGYDLAIATGKSRRGLDKVLRDTELEAYFPITRCADEAFSKPHPKMLEEVLTDHDLEVGRALMIGDSEYDIQMANNANMDSLAVSYGVHDLSRLLKQNPLGHVDALTEIPHWLSNYE